MHMSHIISWSNERKHDGKQNKSVAHAEDNNAEPSSKEHDKHVRFRGAQGDDGQEGGETSMEYTWTDLGQCLFDLVQSLLVFGLAQARWWNNYEVAVSNMGRVIDSKTESNNHLEHYNIVKGETPVKQ